MLRAYCATSDKDPKEEVHLVLSVAREVVQESFNSFQLLFAHTVSLRPNDSFKGRLVARRTFDEPP